jgi:hypothetical protein
MPRNWPTAATAALLVVAASCPPVAADEAISISTGGKGDLTMCPYSWAYTGCNVYHHIKLPAQIAVGDKVRLRFGSNPKQYYFPVARIVRDGDTCTVFSQLGKTTDVEKIEIASCGEASPPQ